MKQLSPKDVITVVQNMATAKASLSNNRCFALAILAGIYIAMGAVLSVVVGFGFPELSAGNPGLQRLLSGITFPIGLLLVVFAGAELFTGNNAIMMPGVLAGKVTFRSVLRNWIVVYLGNFVGALLFTWIMVYCAGTLSAEPWSGAVERIGIAKVSLDWGVVFVRGIGANWLVCLAVWFGIAASSPSAKIIGLWFPIMCFVALGYEHSIANMFFIPLAMMQGADITISQFVFDNLIPATLGNITGGALFVGAIYWWIYKN